jgi:hypothetical protein
LAREDDTPELFWRAAIAPESVGHCRFEKCVANKPNAIMGLGSERAVCHRDAPISLVGEIAERKLDPIARKTLGSGANQGADDSPTESMA